MIQTDTDVCNLAIGRIGGDPIESLSEDSPLGAYCQANYPQKRDWLLGKHRWNFSTALAQLAAVTPAAGQPLPYAFVKPGDMIGAGHAYRDGPAESANNVRVTMNANGLYSTSPVVWIEYSARVAEASWPVWFVELVRIAFAADLAMHVQNRGLAADLHELAFGPPGMEGQGGLYGDARNEDARNAPQRQLFYDSSGPLVDARFNGPFGGGVRIGGFINF